MITFKAFLNEMIDVTLLIEIFLSGLLGEDIIEVEVFRGVPVIHLYFLALGIRCDTRITIVVFKFSFEEGTKSYCGLYVAAH